MKQKNCSRIFSVIFLLCAVTLVITAVYRAYAKPVIGGAGIPTFLFSLRQTVFSPSGLVITGLGVMSLIACIITNITNIKKP